MIQMDKQHPTGVSANGVQGWSGPLNGVSFDAAGIQACLLNLANTCYLVRQAEHIGATTAGQPAASGNGQADLMAILPPVPAEQFGDPLFRARYGLRYAYVGGAMAGGISSEELVIALGKAGMLGSFGAAGLPPARVESAIQCIQRALPNRCYAFNLIHSPSEEALERRAVELYLQYGVPAIEASAYLALTPHVVRYRVAGLRLNVHNQIEIGHRVMAKLSRREVASQFLQPAPPRLLGELLEQGLITQQQAHLAQYVPMADDITVEADSGGHTDNRPLVCLLPSILELRDEIQARHRYPHQVCVGAAGGIGTPPAVLAAFMMGAAYIVTGSVNQACLEAGTSEHTHRLLAQADMADVIMAPSADMFEMGVKVQLLKKGTFFPMRAQKLYDIYQSYDSLDSIPSAERTKLERQIFQKSLDAVWQETVAYFEQRDPEQINRAEDNPKRKMALVFRWYLGLSSRWSNSGTTGREMDYQIWCGPAMGAFNDWVRGTYLEDPANRRIVDVAYHLLHGAAYLYRLQQLSILGIQLANISNGYRPVPLTSISV
ncbi:MAG: PfaD family polyunsaturated fatty acid/polyketide biosynthesis protein [Chloroflexaceae bacterium]|nr:PfaD family polyunsaturated fatty acid/polyketide biosynthesis protein [Chloroflexaceae bacterium]